MFGRIIFHRHLIPAIANQLAETGPAACRKVLAVLEVRHQILRTPEYPGRVSGRNRFRRVESDWPRRNFGNDPIERIFLRLTAYRLRSEAHPYELQSLLRIS